MKNEHNLIPNERLNSENNDRHSLNGKDHLLLLDNVHSKKDEPTPDEGAKHDVIQTSHTKQKNKDTIPLINTNLTPNIRSSPSLHNQNTLKRSLTMNSTQIIEIETFESKSLKFINKLLEDNYYVIFMTLVTIYALFGSDINTAFLTADADHIFDILSTVAFALFSIELILSCIAKKDYLFSFFFWLDLISTVSLILEIDFMFSPILNAAGITRVLRVIRIIRLIRIVKLYKNATIAKKKMEEEKKKKEEKHREQLRQKMIADEMSRNQTNLSASQQTANRKPRKSILHILNPLSMAPVESSRLLIDKEQNNLENIQQNDYVYSRLDDNNKEAAKTHRDNPDRLVLSKKPSHNHNNNEMEININGEKIDELLEKRQENEKENSANPDGLSYEQMAEESKISKMLSESITKKVIMLILAMLFVLPLSEVSLWDDDSTLSYNYISGFIDRYYSSDGGTLNNDTYKRILREIKENEDPVYPILNITIGSQVLYVGKANNDKLRTSDINAIVDDYLGYTLILYSSQELSKAGAIISIVRTCFVCLVITVTAVMLEDATKRLVLDPLEVMIEIVQNVAKDPMNAKNVENLQSGLKNMVTKLEEEENVPAETKDKNLTKEKLKSGKKKQYEIYVIQQAIIKISALLSIGFGEAGGEVIKENISGAQDLNPMLKGNKKMAIFGFCDIRNFPVVTEALQEKTIVFVNEIAEIVHSCVDKFGGAANKNIGDAFLMVWKFKKPEKKKGKKTKVDEVVTFNPELPENKSIADQALLGFLNVIIKINRSEHILAYRNNPEILKNAKNYKVNMGFGLHLGWAIEGSIGSTYKIDASYLSPNVNISARLEGATRQYGVSILISGELYNCLSDELKEICRLIDIVTVKGAKTITKLYTVDVNLDLTPKKSKITNKAGMAEKRNKFTEKREEVLLGIQDIGSVGKYAMCRNSFIELLELKRPAEFLTYYNEGFDYYISGEWEKAGEAFRECLRLDPKDGPTNTLYNFIQSHNFKKTEDWNGFRPLGSK